MEEKELKVNHTYLLQFGSSDIVSSVTILMITDTAFYVRWNRGEDSNDTWELKKVINRNYNVLEDITNQISTQTTIKDKPKTKLIQCPICHGFGTVPDEKTTGGTSTCPLCQGSKMIPESIET